MGTVMCILLGQAKISHMEEFFTLAWRNQRTVSRSCLGVRAFRFLYIFFFLSFFILALWNSLIINTYNYILMRHHHTNENKNGVLKFLVYVRAACSSVKWYQLYRKLYQHIYISHKYLIQYVLDHFLIEKKNCNSVFQFVF